MLTLSCFSKDATAKLGRSGYADSTEPSSGPGSAHLRNMFSTTTDAAEERPTRKLKKENRFYNFLTRSRSRSRSKQDHSPHRNRDSIPQVPQNGNTQEHPDSKPPYRIPSRPLSSTTTATNTTITPGTPKAKRNPQSAIPVPSASRPENSTNRSRPNTPSQSTSNRRKINIFGISFGSSKSRSRSHSRPGTPRASVDVPPLPIYGFEEDARGPQHAPHPQPSSRPSSPSPPDPKPEPTLPGHDPPTHVNGTNGDAYAGSSKLRELFSGSSCLRVTRRGSLISIQGEILVVPGIRILR
ncbi:hypothetical protein P691DRAFT_811048 [Macrolepiota fuliginosa MF-IS2]|uniref:Uncharacterized protein n=1 Tax=Macrolepiota fuliginosa MF-IS2 TaxID=1400762 RepID=A0A9P5XGX0_9AGAR|nr:hypothetical protein P691DRAFT_811048 [Macrolepiota fuliginosa MF-IS2]